MLLKPKTQALRLSLSDRKYARRRSGNMKNVRLLLMAVLIGLLLPFGLFAQKGGNTNRPPKEKPRIVEGEKKPPPTNSNRGRPE